MKFYWKVSEIPELKDLPSSVRKQVWRAALRTAMFRWTTLGATFVFILLGKFVVARVLGWDDSLGVGIGAAAGMMLAWQSAVKDIRNGKGPTKASGDTWFVRIVVTAGIVVCLGLVWLVSSIVGRPPPPGVARLEVDMATSKIELAGADYVVRGMVINKGTALGSTSRLKATFLKSGVELGSRTYPLKLGPIAPGQWLDFAQRLDEPDGTTGVVPSVDTVTEPGSRLIGAVADFSPRLLRLWCTAEANADQRIRVCTAVIQSGQESPGNMAIAFASRGLAYHHKEQDELAVQDYDQAIRLKPDYAAAFTNRGVAYDEAYQYDRAIQDYDQAIRLAPGNAAAFNGRCYAKASAGRLDEALADCNESLRLRTGDAYALDSRAFTELKMERFQESIADFDAALKTSPQMASALLGRGTARRHLADFTAGDADIAAALKIDPEIRAKYARRGVTP
jgi:Tfp pilus assembly protein PilF